ncbi:glutamate racemase [Xylanibacillus composti]|uniref:Glutamate racemase n=1 Tax=Xylanibacillus composti TaxID=1572762 RepID=A0A8J4H227_9BACL|nr:glutamate racemase [Xylanibacillus composti]MDT9724919.1 glutamate racemase [Xylanibacillus composti]GIQ68155.1 glutamate racemase 1 [Xylanibacillus composti]
MQHPIAILDSGVGGITVAKEIIRQLPQEKIVYFGDSARSPYGPRKPEEIVRFTMQIVRYLLRFQPKLLVIACNTATAVALDQVRASVSIPVVGVICPGARAAVKKTKSGVIGVIGTECTVRSQAYDQALKDLSPKLEVLSQPCPRFVPLVEQGDFHSPQAKQAVWESLAPLKHHAHGKPMDCLILGCTHYPFLQDAISSVMGSGVELINSAEETARETSAVLHHQGQLAKTRERPVHHFLCSGNPATFQGIAREWLNEDIQVTPVVWQGPKYV